MTVLIRKAQRQDALQLWRLMKELALFEKYIDSFAITPDIVTQRGFDKEPPDFHCLVAEEKGRLVGMAVYYFLPFTAQNRPAIFLKELYVAADYRNRHIGERLMRMLRAEAKRQHCVQIKWTVAAWNDHGKRFYARLGAKQNNDWLNYEWSVDDENLRSIDGAE